MIHISSCFLDISIQMSLKTFKLRNSTFSFSLLCFKFFFPLCNPKLGLVIISTQTLELKNGILSSRFSSSPLPSKRGQTFAASTPPITPSLYSEALLSQQPTPWEQKSCHGSLKFAVFSSPNLNWTTTTVSFLVIKTGAVCFMHTYFYHVSLPAPVPYNLRIPSIPCTPSLPQCCSRQFRAGPILPDDSTTFLL